MMRSYKIVAVAAITDGNAGDSPVSANLSAKTTRSSGYLPSDSAYCLRDNCRVSRLLGRELCFRLKKSFGPHRMNE